MSPSLISFCSCETSTHAFVGVKDHALRAGSYPADRSLEFGGIGTGVFLPRIAFVRIITAEKLSNVDYVHHFIVVPCLNKHLLLTAEYILILFGVRANRDDFIDPGGNLIVPFVYGEQTALRVFQRHNFDGALDVVQYLQ